MKMNPNELDDITIRIKKITPMVRADFERAGEELPKNGVIMYGTVDVSINKTQGMCLQKVDFDRENNLYDLRDKFVHSIMALTGFRHRQHREKKEWGDE